ncbi:putative nucleotidyltransferase, ribonuclease H [Tanacetum coccineum]
MQRRRAAFSSRDAMPYIRICSLKSTAPGARAKHIGISIWEKISDVMDVNDAFIRTQSLLCISFELSKTRIRSSFSVVPPRCHTRALEKESTFHPPRAVDNRYCGVHAACPPRTLLRSRRSIIESGLHHSSPEVARQHSAISYQSVKFPGRFHLLLEFIYHGSLPGKSIKIFPLYKHVAFTIACLEVFSGLTFLTPRNTYFFIHESAECFPEFQDVLSWRTSRNTSYSAMLSLNIELIPPGAEVYHQKAPSSSIRHQIELRRVLEGISYRSCVDAKVTTPADSYEGNFSTIKPLTLTKLIAKRFTVIAFLKGLGCISHAAWEMNCLCLTTTKADDGGELYLLMIIYQSGTKQIVDDALSSEVGYDSCIKSGFWASLRVEPNLISQIKTAQKDDGEIWAIIQNIDQQTEFRVDDDGILWQGTKLCVPEDPTLREALMTEAHSSPFSIHPGSTKMYHDLKQHFWWSGMKRDVATFVSKCLTCQQVKIEHQRASGLLQPLEIPVWKWDEISMDFVTGLPRTQRKHDAIWVVVDRLTKSAHFLPIRKDYPKGLQKAWGTRLKFSTAFHLETDGQSERTIQTLEDMLRSCALEWAGNWDDYICLVEFAYNNSWHASIKCAPFEMLYGRKCRAPICWDQVGERILEGPEMIEVTNEKVAVAREKLKEAQTRQKSYADRHRRALEFQPGEHVFLKVSPTRGVRRFGIKGKLSPRFIGPFEILDRVGEVSYRLALPPQLSHVHNVFHVSLLRGYKYHPLHVVSYPFDQIREDLSYTEEPESILDRQDRVMRNKTIPFVKILWRNHPEREATWETEESIRTSYPHFLP